MTGTYADPTTSDVTLTTNSTNAKYVQPTETGTLAPDFTAFNPALDGDGLNPEARTYIAEGFRIRYGGDTAATVRITSDAEGSPSSRAERPRRRLRRHSRRTGRPERRAGDPRIGDVRVLDVRRRGGDPRSTGDGRGPPDWIGFDRRDADRDAVARRPRRSGGIAGARPSGPGVIPIGRSSRRPRIFSATSRSCG